MLSGFSAKSLVVIDAKVDDYQTLIKGISTQHEAIVLNPAEDGVRQITAALRDRPHLQTLHIVSHGAPGTLFLGNSELSLRSLDRNALNLQSWSAAAILLYGCSVAAGDAGAEFLEKLHQLTNAEIAASTTPVGSTILGGNWDLDVQTGSMDVELAIALETQRTYASTLAMTVLQESDAADLLNTILGTTTGLSNITATLSGNAQAFGTFSSDPFGLGSGIVISTGRAVDVVGPNNSASTTTDHGINSGSGQFDKATLTITFDADSTVDQIFFNYVFGSEEFIEFAGGSVNDSFKLFVNGTNLAKLSNGNDVTINNLVPNQNNSTTWSSDFINNTNGIASQNTQLDGYTKVMTLQGSLIKNATNTIVIEIADVGDAGYDSAVFIKGDSLGTAPPPTVNPPAVPTGLALVANAVNDTGASQSDRVTSNLRPQFSGSAEPGSTIKLYANGTEIAGSFTMDGSGNWTFTPAADLPTGTVSMTARATNAGGESADSTAISVTIDNSIAAPSIPDLTTDSGLPTDNITNVVRPTLQGTAEPNSTIRLFDGATMVSGDITANGSGNWSYTFTSDLIPGVHSFQAMAVDAAGNISPLSPELSVTIDNTPPTIDPASKPNLEASSDTGISDTDDKTNLTSLTFTGQLTPAEAGLLVRIYDGNTMVGTGIVTASGAWSVNTTNVGTGARSITYTLTDLAGNESQRSGELTVEVDATAPTLPSGSIPDMTPASDTGTSATDDRTGDSTPEFVGQLTPAEAGFIVTIYSDSMPVGIGTVNADGSWSVITDPLVNGSTEIRYTLTDLFGNESLPSDSLTVEIDAVLPPAPSIAPDLLSSSDTGSSQTDDITADNTPTFGGTGTAGQIVRLYSGTTQVGESVVDAEGNWTITASTLEAGDRAITTTFVDPLTGNESLLSPVLLVKIDPTAIVTPTVTPGNGSSGADGSSNRSSGLTNNSRPPLSGVTDPSSTIEVLANGQPVPGTATVNPDGTWRFVPDASLPDGTYKVVVRSISPSGGAVLSPETTLVVDTKPATVTIVDALSDLRDTGTTSLTLQFSEAVQTLDLSDLTLTLNGKTVNLQGATLTAKDGQTWVLGNLPTSTAPSGQYKISVNPGRITDLAGNPLTLGATDGWITGYTANALPLARSGGRPGMRMSGNNRDNWMLGTQRRDLLRGGGGNDFLLGSGGNDRLTGGRGRDRLAGGSGNDRAIGGSGNDRLQGFRGQDVLIGGSGNDFLAGGAGDDLLQGGAGNDRLRGGVGRDTFAVNSLSERVDRVLDFNASEDLLDLRGIMRAPEYRADNRFAQYYQYVKLAQVGSNTEVQVDADGRGSGTAMTTVMTLQNVNTSSLQSTNFVIG